MSGMPSFWVTCKDQRGRGYRLPSTGPCSLPRRDGILLNPLAAPCSLGLDAEDKTKKGMGCTCLFSGCRWGRGGL